MRMYTDKPSLRDGLATLKHHTHLQVALTDCDAIVHMYTQLLSIASLSILSFTVVLWICTFILYQLSTRVTPPAA